jgi:hypothetical protein
MTSQLARVTFAASLSLLSFVAGCATDDDEGPPPDDVSMTDPEAITTCTKTVYVHVIAYGYTDYAALTAGKNSCWGLEAPKMPGGATWSICKYNATNPSGAARWAYDDVNIGASGHADATDVANCRARNGGASDTIYVAANSGGGWSHSGVSGGKYLNECYDTDSKVANRQSGCTSNGAPMWNIGVSTNVYNDVLALARSRRGSWIGIYAPTVGLHGKEAAIVSALNYYTTH